MSCSLHTRTEKSAFHLAGCAQNVPWWTHKGESRLVWKKPHWRNDKKQCCCRVSYFYYGCRIILNILYYVWRNSIYARDWIIFWFFLNKTKTCLQFYFWIIIFYFVSMCRLVQIKRNRFRSNILIDFDRSHGFSFDLTRSIREQFSRWIIGFSFITGIIY